MVHLLSLRACTAVLSSLRAVALPVAALALLPSIEVRAQEAGYGQTLGTSPMERQILDYGPDGGGSGGGTILDVTNPMELLNKLKRSSALEEATPPSSAVDQALKDLDAQMTEPASPGTSGQLKGI